MPPQPKKRPKFTSVPPSTWVTAEEAARRNTALRENFLKVLEELRSIGGLTGWRIFGEEPDPEPTSDEDL